MKFSPDTHKGTPHHSAHQVSASMEDAANDPSSIVSREQIQ